MRRAVTLVVGLILVLVTVAGWALLRTENELNEVQADRFEQVVPARIGVARLLTLLVDQETGERGYLLTGQDRYLEPYERAGRSIGPLITDLSARTQGIPGMDELLQEVRRAHRAWVNLAAEPEIAAVRAGREAYAERLVGSGTGRLLFDQVRQAHATADARIAAQEASTAQRIDELSRRLSLLLGGTLVLLLVLAVLAALTLERFVLRPLQFIGAGVRRVSAGDLTHAVEPAGPPEFRRLADDVDSMRRRMLDEIESARHATEALALREPTVAALQASLAPSLASAYGVEVGARLEPAEGVLAGDFVDSVVLGPGRLALVLGDVAGHGPVPAIFGLRLKLLLGSMLASGFAPGEVLRGGLQRLEDVEEETFATVFVAIVDSEAGSISYANAGHPAPLVLSAARRGNPRMLSSTGPFLSPMLPSARWETKSVPFAVDDLLLAYTDGVVEARDADGRELGLDPTIDALSQQRPDAEFEQILDAVYGRIRDHAQALRDDTTLVLCRLKPGDALTREDTAAVPR